MSYLRILLAVIVRPWLWWTASRTVFRLAVTNWWRRPPFLPLPSREYIEFRLVTAYGDKRVPPPDDIVNYLRWCRAFPKRSGEDT